MKRLEEWWLIPRPDGQGICGAAECLLIDRNIPFATGEILLKDLLAKGVEVRTDEKYSKIAGTVLADDQDYGQEFLDSIIAVKTVSGVNEAIEHIKRYGSGHTEAIITETIQLLRCSLIIWILLF